MINTFVFTGRPGSGKGAQSKALAEKLGCKRFSFGEHYRKIAEKDSVFGRKIKEIIDRGDIAPSWTATFLLEEALFNLKDEELIVLDGMGRTEVEVRLFAEVAQFLSRDFRIIYLETSEETIRGRVAKRAEIENRADDNDIEYRFKKYNEETQPAISYLRSLGKVIDIDGEPAPEVIASEIWNKVSPLLN
jgi:adenylate kinase